MALTKDDDLVYLFTGTSEVFIKNRITRILQSFNKQTYAVIKYDCEVTPLNTIINDMIITKIKEALENYHENGLAILETTETTILFDGSSAMYNSVSIEVSEAVRISVENNYPEYFSVSAPDTATAGTITIDITGIECPETLETTEFDFIVKLISQATDEMIKKVTCTVTLQVPSTTPED